MQQDKEKLENSGQTKSRAAREPQRINLNERLAFSPGEFAAALGRSPTYGYRQIYAGRIKPISDAGNLLILKTTSVSVRRRLLDCVSLAMISARSFPRRFATSGQK